LAGIVIATAWSNLKFEQISAELKKEFIVLGHHNELDKLQPQRQPDEKTSSNSNRLYAQKGKTQGGGAYSLIAVRVEVEAGKS